VVDYIFSIVLIVIALVAIELRKSYHAVPRSELRYRARQGDVLAEKIYTAVAYEDSLEALLWLVIVLSVAGSFILFSVVAPPWIAFIALVIFLWLAFAWLPKIQVNKLTNKLAIYLTPAIVWTLNTLHPFFKTTNNVLLKSKTQDHTGIYETNDLVTLLDKQKDQSDNRVSPDQLELIKNILELSKKTVGEHSETWSNITHVNSNDTVGPVLLDELHKSKQQFVPVVDSDKKEAVGMIDLKRLNISTTGEIKDLMDPNIHFLSEEDSLEDALNSIIDSGHPVYIVRDKKDRLFGMITLKDIMNELVVAKEETEEVIPEEPENAETEATTEAQDSLNEA
jgi:CBS domain containing-hemolysin-like protein